MQETTYKICSRCVMDTSAQEVHFDANGYCNFCEALITKIQNGSSANNKSDALDDLMNKVKRQGRKKKYDCIIGVSGGIDSSWVLVQAVKHGLRPLAVHMDNGWNSELATNNISSLLGALNVDLFTYVIEWEEYRRLMESFFDADVIDIELLYDNAMTEVCYMKAREFGLKHILSGSNTATEGMQMPKCWAYEDKWDGTNIVAIASKNNATISSFPLFTNAKWLYSRYIKGIQWVPFLDYQEYDKNAATETLQREYGFKPYPYKHYENVFTRFYQSFILPTKFGVDKRRVHLSSLIISNQLTRDEAISVLQTPAFISAEQLRLDTDYFLRKMGWEKTKLDAYLSRTRKEHSEFKTDMLRKWLFPILRISATVTRRVTRRLR